MVDVLDEEHEPASVPPPWHLTGTSYWFFSFSPLFKKSPVPAGGISREVFGDGDGTDEQFRGGLGCIQIIRYNSSPVGPYDELIFVPGNFLSPPLSPVSGSKASSSSGSKMLGLKITRIFVSTQASLINGRSNWSIPKELADFTFTHLTPSDTNTIDAGRGDSEAFEVSVRLPKEKGGREFFKAKVTPVKKRFWIPSDIPFQTVIGRGGSWNNGGLSLLDPLLQLPLSPSVVPTDTSRDFYKRFMPNISGVVSFVWLEPFLTPHASSSPPETESTPLLFSEGKGKSGQLHSSDEDKTKKTLGNGIDFPLGDQTYSLGIVWKDCESIFEEPKLYTRC